MSNPNDPPFATKSTKTARSPDRTKLGRREPSTYPENRTRNQSSSRVSTQIPKTSQNTEKVTQQIPPATNNLEEQFPPATNNLEPIVITNKQTHKMNQKELQQCIANFIPEFSGEDSPYTQDKLLRFIGTADSIYETLTTEEDKSLFNRLVKLRLTDDAYVRISQRDITCYTKLREILSKMYAKSYSLNELERGFTDLRQSYGETIRNYGYRLMDALEKYKKGYKTKYNLQKMEDSYSKHLNSSLVQIFKCGLNNTILKEKIATLKANDVDEIIKETETIEKLLALSTGTSRTETAPATATQVQLETNQMIRNQPAQVICNYCQRQNHTWDICRTRMSHERSRRMATRPPQYNQQFQRNQFTPNQFPNSNRNPNNYQPFYKPSPTQNQSYTSRHPFQMTNNQPLQPSQNYRQPFQPNKFQPKYCSHCKTTTGHTFDECRSKFLARTPIQYTNPNHNQPNKNSNREYVNTDELTNKFNNMRINVMYPQPEEDEQIPELYEQSHSGNSNGSDQS